MEQIEPVKRESEVVDAKDRCPLGFAEDLTGLVSTAEIPVGKKTTKGPYLFLHEELQRVLTQFEILVGKKTTKDPDLFLLEEVRRVLTQFEILVGEKPTKGPDLFLHEEVRRVLTQFEKKYPGLLAGKQPDEGCHDTTKFDPIATGSVDGIPFQALADTCATNLVSRKLLKRLAKPYDRSSKRLITRADGSRFSTLGVVSMSWSFAGEKASHIVKFDVIPHHMCQYAITLGGKFLHATKTFTRFAHRITRTMRSIRSPRVFLQGGEQLRLAGYCNGTRVDALPDSCSDVNLLSPDKAALLEAAGSSILRDEAHYISLELPGNRFVKTVGLMQGMNFRFGDENNGATYTQDFYILPGLPADVLLGSSLLAEADAFRKYEQDIFELPDEAHSEHNALTIFLNIRKAKSILDKFRKPKAKEDDALKNWRDRQLELRDRMQAVYDSVETPEVKQALLALLEEEYNALLQRKPTQ